MSEYEKMIEELEDAVQNGCNYDTLESALKMIKDLRNIACLKCGEYKTAYLGSCDNCRFRA